MDISFCINIEHIRKFHFFLKSCGFILMGYLGRNGNNQNVFMKNIT